MTWANHRAPSGLIESFAILGIDAHVARDLACLGWTIRVMRQVIDDALHEASGHAETIAVNSAVCRLLRDALAAFG